MATLPIHTTNDEGVAVTWNVANAGGDKFPNTGTIFLLLKNDDVSATTVTVVTGRTFGSLGVEDRDIVVPAGGIVIAGPFSVGTYNDENGSVSLTYSSVTSLTIGVETLGASA